MAADSMTAKTGLRMLRSERRIGVRLDPVGCFATLRRSVERQRLCEASRNGGPRSPGAKAVPAGLYAAATRASSSGPIDPVRLGVRIPDDNLAGRVHGRAAHAVAVESHCVYLPQPPVILLQEAALRVP